MTPSLFKTLLSVIYVNVYELKTIFQIKINIDVLDCLFSQRILQKYPSVHDERTLLYFLNKSIVCMKVLLWKMIVGILLVFVFLLTTDGGNEGEVITRSPLGRFWDCPRLPGIHKILSHLTFSKISQSHWTLDRQQKLLSLPLALLINPNFKWPSTIMLRYVFFCYGPVKFLARFMWKIFMIPLFRPHILRGEGVSSWTSIREN